MTNYKKRKAEGEQSVFGSMTNKRVHDVPKYMCQAEIY